MKLPFTVDNNILGVITQGFNWKYQFSFGMSYIFQEYPNLCQFYYRIDREQNGTLSGKCGAPWKIYQWKWNLAHVERKHFCSFTENFMEKS